MKKLFAVILTLCLLLASVSALAANQPPKQPPKGQAPENAPQMLDLDAMVKNGVIGQETADKIKAYMESNRPEGATEGQAPGEPEEPDDDEDDDDDDGEPDEPDEPDDDDDDDDDDDAPDGILGELLKAGVITQEECEAMAAAMPDDD